MNQTIHLDEEMRFVMRKLFYEDDAFPISNTPLPSRIGSTFLNLTLVPYQNPSHFFSKVAKVIKVWKVYSTYINSTSSGGGSSSQLGSCRSLFHKGLYSYHLVNI